MDELIAEVLAGIRSATDKDSLVSLAYQSFSIPYCESIARETWRAFIAQMNKIDPDDSGKTVVGVDFSDIFHAHYFIHEVEAAHYTLKKIKSLSQKITNHEFIVCIDADSYWRKQLYPKYKSSRNTKPAGFTEVYQKAIEDIAKEGFRIEQHADKESDDLLSSIAFMAKVRKQRAVIVTEDRDMLQSLGPGVSLYSSRSDEFRDVDWLMQQYQITPRQVVDYLCLVGKDDVPSPDGIGDKTASKWLSKYSSFVGIMDASETFTPAKRDLVRDYASRPDGYWLARELHTLNKNVEIFW